MNIKKIGIKTAIALTNKQQRGIFVNYGHIFLPQGGLYQLRKDICKHAMDVMLHYIFLSHLDLSTSLYVFTLIFLCSMQMSTDMSQVFLNFSTLWGCLQT